MWASEVPKLKAREDKLTAAKKTNKFLRGLLTIRRIVYSCLFLMNVIVTSHMYIYLRVCTELRDDVYLQYQFKYLLKPHAGCWES